MQAEHCRQISGRRRYSGGENVAIGPMLYPMTKGIEPIIEDLAAEEMPANPPDMVIVAGREIVVPDHQTVEIGDLERGMVELRWLAGDRREIERVMIARQDTPITADEQGCRSLRRVQDFIG